MYDSTFFIAIWSFITVLGCDYVAFIAHELHDGSPVCFDTRNFCFSALARQQAVCSLRERSITYVMVHLHSLVKLTIFSSSISQFEK